MVLLPVMSLDNRTQSVGQGSAESSETTWTCLHEWAWL